MKIKGWQRMGIIASVIWILGAGLYTLSRLSDKDIKTAGFFYSQCASTRDESNQVHRLECEKKSERAFAVNMTAVFSKCMAPYDKEFWQTDAKCTKESEDYAVNAIPSERLGAAIVAFGPVPVAWGGAYLVIFLTRWVKRGFEST